MIVACGALPRATWLDGTSAGEQAIDELLALLIGQGRGRRSTSSPTATGTSPIPRRAQLKVRKLHEIVAHLPRSSICRSTSAPR